MLLLLPLAFLGGGSDEPDDTVVQELPPVSSEDEARTEDLLLASREGRYSDARILLGSSITRPFPGAAFESVFGELQQILRRKVTRDGLLIYSAALRNMVKRDLPIQGLDFHIRHLRQLCLSYGGRPLLADVMDPLIEMPRLNQSRQYRDSHEAVLEHLILFDRWDQAIVAFKRLAEERFAPGARAGLERLLLGAHIARIAAKSTNPEATDAYGRFVATMASELRLTTADTERTNYWLQGLQRYHSTDRNPDRGAPLIKKGLPVNLMHPGYVSTRIDLALAWWDEARRLEAGLRAEFLPADTNRARQLFQLGTGAAQLDDQEDLVLALTRLSEDGAGSRLSAAYRELLRGARDLLRGLEDAGKERINAVLAESTNKLSLADRKWWQDVAEAGAVPLDDPGRVLFENGKIWVQLRQWERLQRVMKRLRKQLASNKDLAALNFLKAISAYRANELTGVREHLLDILDEGPPLGLTRQEVAALLVLAEERAGALEQIRDLRRSARNMTADLVVEDSTNMRTKLGLVTLWQIDLDEGGHDFLVSDLGKQRFEALLQQLDVSWLPFPLLERWLDLETQLLMLARGLRSEGKLTAALDATDAARRLVGQTERYRDLDGMILLERAHETSPAEGELRKARLREAGGAFTAAATGGMGDQRFHFDAAHAYYEAGDIDAARQSLQSFSAHDRSSAEAERRYWSKFVLMARLERAVGRHHSAVKICTHNLETEDAGPLRYQFALERGRNLELRGRDGDEDAALADYDFVYNGLFPKNPAWQEAVYQRAKILHQRLITTDPDAAAAPKLARDALASWEDLASRVDSGSGREFLAEALYRAAEGRTLMGQRQGARRHLRRLEVVAGEVLSTAATRLTPEQTAGWRRFAEKGAFALADSYFDEKDIPQARARYGAACREYADSPLAVWGYLQLGQLAADDRDVATAQRHYQFALRKLESLTEAEIKDLPPRWEKTFWEKTLREKLADLSDKLTTR
ncbi:MAG: hypothetical protein AAF581_10665 [Planctomycetota bacterium]